VTPVRVLVVDDSPVVRRLLVQALQTDARIRVVGVAENGRQGLLRVEELRPDLVTLDMEMPELDGAATMRELRRAHPTLPVLLVSSRSRSSVSATLDALGAGRVDYVEKPSAGGMAAFTSELGPRVLNLARASLVAGPTSMAPPAPAAPRRHTRKVRLLVIAASTGGPDALARVLADLPRTFPLPIAVVQHMPPVFTTMFAARLAQDSGFDVVEATDEVELRPGRVVLAPGDHHLTVAARGPLLVGALDRGVQENSCRPSADALFRTAAAAVHGELVALVLTGLGRDGAAGCRAVAQAGGRILAQDRATSVAWGMPGAVVETGLADQVLPLGEIAQALTALAFARAAGRSP
jgi:two-component system, chemotaxis family, protein-glutamate methylesterase/glutaminase